jgi:hypothetical protein
MFRVLSILLTVLMQILSAVWPLTAQAANGGSMMHGCAAKYVGNSYSHKFHRPGCPFAKQIWGDRIVEFQYRQQAVDDHYLPCQYCLPRVWLSVHACIICPVKPKPN